MFVITEADAVAIRTIFNQEGELSAAIELRRRFPRITGNREARACARSIAGWKPLLPQLRPVTWLQRKSRHPSAPRCVEMQSPRSAVQERPLRAGCVPCQAFISR
jgi:hypothetical protein